MIEKEPIKMSLKVFIILVLVVLIIIGIIVGCCYTVFNNKSKLEVGYQNLSLSVEGEENIIQGNQNNSNINENKNYEMNSVKDTDEKENIIQTNQNNNINENQNNEICSIKDAEIVIKEYLNIMGTLSGSPDAVLDYLGYTNYNNGEFDDEGYVKTNIKYEEFKKQIMDVMTEKYMTEKFGNYFKDKNGTLYVLQGGGSGIEYDVKEVVYKGDRNNVFIANVDSWVDESAKENNNIEFHVEENINGKYIINYCD